jgi:predicted nucleotidyltransferase component of viral defense system
MRYGSAAAFGAALDQRLKTQSERTGVALGRLRKRVAFELFLRRLIAVAPGRWVLKGAFALDLRLSVATRPTKDIDLGRDDSPDTAIEDIVAAQQLDLGDYFSFAATRTDAFADTDEFAAIRFNVRAELAGRTFDQFIVDIGFSDPITWTPDMITTSDLLAFAEIKPIDIPAVPIAQHLAEKVHAYTRRYGETQRASTRPKDLIDILLIASAETIKATALRDALQRTFQARARQALPGALPEPPDDWRRPFAQLASQVEIETDLHAAFHRAAEFLDPVLADTATGRWEPRSRSWTNTDAST